MAVRKGLRSGEGGRESEAASVQRSFLQQRSIPRLGATALLWDPILILSACPWDPLSSCPQHRKSQSSSEKRPQLRFQIKHWDEGHQTHALRVPALRGGRAGGGPGAHSAGLSATASPIAAPWELDLKFDTHTHTKASWGCSSALIPSLCFPPMLLFYLFSLFPAPSPVAIAPAVPSVPTEPM